MNDLTLQKARAYEAEHGAAISPAERPAYHMTPYVGWLNDPNGFSYYKGKYHQFYQYNPYDVRWAPMHWGQADNIAQLDHSAQETVVKIEYRVLHQRSRKDEGDGHVRKRRGICICRRRKAVGRTQQRGKNRRS